MFYNHITMANNAAMRQVLIHIGSMQAAAQAIVDKKGINSMDEMMLVKDEEKMISTNNDKVILCLRRLRRRT
jgi:hypothetical protein